VRERLRQGEPAAARVQALTEERDRDVVGAAWLRAERRGRRVEPPLVVREDLASARDRVLNRVAVTRQRDPRRGSW
jgi:hypothetical protein